MVNKVTWKICRWGGGEGKRAFLYTIKLMLVWDGGGSPLAASSIYSRIHFCATNASSYTITYFETSSKPVLSNQPKPESDVLLKMFVTRGQYWEKIAQQIASEREKVAGMPIRENLGFSRGEQIFKKITNFVVFCIMSTKLIFWALSNHYKDPRLFFFFPHTSHDHQFYGVTSGFTRLNMRTKCVLHILISRHVNFHNDRTMWTVTIPVKTCRWGGRKKSQTLYWSNCCAACKFLKKQSK